MSRFFEASRAVSRPPGELIWAHATSGERFLGLCDLGCRLKTMRPDLTMMISWETDTRPVLPQDGCDIAFGPLAVESPSEIRSFLDHWAPDLCIWTGGKLRRLLMRQLRDRGWPALLVDITAHELPSRASRWLPDQRHRLLNGFREILVPSHEVAALLKRAGVPDKNIRVSGQLLPSTSPPSCNEEELAHMQEQLNTRPCWLAAHLSKTEILPVLTAHRSALRLLHRLLLVMTFDTQSDLETARRMLRLMGMSFVDWDVGEEPDDHCQLVIGLSEDLGLWYRLCPLSFMGHSLIRGSKGMNPLDAAALGSAVLHGPGTVSHNLAYQRLADSGAARRVYSEEDLAQEILDLTAPDQAAEMALAGWQVVTESAAMTDHLLDTVQDILDQHENSHATT